MIIYTHPACLLHDPGPEHPERPARLEVVLEALRGQRGDADWREAPIVKLGDLRRVHDDALVHEVLEADVTGYRMLDPDTVMCPASRAAALRAAGAGVAAVDAVMNGEDRAVFCAVRPPGHHATGTAAMGFCLFNNVAIAARYAQKRYGLQRVLIVDWDVHHGNGTQHSFEADPSVLFFSTHQYPHYPGTGRATECGTGAGEGFTINVPMEAGEGDDDYRAVFQKVLVPAADAFKPELVIISAGFDAHRDDPLASMGLTEEGYADLTSIVAGIATRHCRGRLLSSLEGGYNLTALAASVERHIRALVAS